MVSEWEGIGQRLVLSVTVCAWLSFVFAVRESGLFVFGGSGVGVPTCFVCLF